MKLRRPRFDRKEVKQTRKVTSKGRYPQMVLYFRRKYDPSKESVYDFVRTAKRGHVAFLRKRGWSDESIDIAWNEILASLARKRQRFVAYRKELKRGVE